LPVITIGPVSPDNTRESKPVKDKDEVYKVVKLPDPVKTKPIDDLNPYKVVDLPGSVKTVLRLL
jgi:hypothetical protein